MWTKKEAKEYQKRYERENKERIAREVKEYAITYRRGNRERIAKEARERALKSKYNLSNEQIVELYNTTVCQICGVETKRICVDHDHKSGKVRGYLCINCNSALGMAKDNVSILERMIMYLKGDKNG